MTQDDLTTDDKVDLTSHVGDDGERTKKFDGLS
jgi:hypothetical protein